MKVIFWNTRGFGNPATRLVLANFCVEHKPDFVFISEPKIIMEQLPANFCRGLNLKVFVMNNREHLIPSIWGFCSQNLNPTILLSSQQQFSFCIVHNFICYGYLGLAKLKTSNQN